jgi:hypothetical protein
VNQYRGRIVDYFVDKEWRKLPPLSAFADPASKAGQAAGKAVSLGARVADFAKSLGMSPVILVLWVSIIAVMILLFTVWVLWLITDYRLKRNLIEDEAHQRAVYKALHPDSDWSDEEEDQKQDNGAKHSDSGNESDSEGELLGNRKAAKALSATRQRPSRRASS